MIYELFCKLYYFRIFSKLPKHGRKIRLGKAGVIAHPEELEMGSNIFIARNFFISARNMKIGNDVLIGPFFVAEGDNHVFDKVGIKIIDNKDRKIGKIVIGNDVWIGADVTMLSNSSIGEGSVIGACSLVTKEMPPYTLCYGIPCKPVISRFSIENLKEHLRHVHSEYTYEQVFDLWKAAKVVIREK